MPDSTGVPAGGQEHPPSHQHDLSGQHQPRPDSQGQPEAAAGLAPPPKLPLTFADAERRSPFGLLHELYEHALTVDLHERGGNDPTRHLAELALSAAVVSRWSQLQPATMHRALCNGATLGQVAAAAGTGPSDAYGRWAAWAESQTNLFLQKRIGLDPAEADMVRQRLRDEATGEVPALPEKPPGQPQG